MTQLQTDQARCKDHCGPRVNTQRRMPVLLSKAGPTPSQQKVQVHPQQHSHTALLHLLALAARTAYHAQLTTQA